MKANCLDDRTRSFIFPFRSFYIILRCLIESTQASKINSRYKKNSFSYSFSCGVGEGTNKKEKVFTAASLILFDECDRWVAAALTAG